MEVQYILALNDSKSQLLANLYASFEATMKRPDAPIEFFYEMAIAASVKIADMHRPGTEKEILPGIYWSYEFEAFRIAVLLNNVAHITNTERKPFIYAFYSCMYAAFMLIENINPAVINRLIISQVEITSFPHFTVGTELSREGTNLRKNMIANMQVFFYNYSMYADPNAFVYNKPTSTAGIEQFLMIACDYMLWMPRNNVIAALSMIPNEHGDLVSARDRMGPWAYYALAAPPRIDVINNLGMSRFVGKPSATRTPYIYEAMQVVYQNSKLPEKLDDLPLDDTPDRYHEIGTDNILVFFPDTSEETITGIIDTAFANTPESALNPYTFAHNVRIVCRQVLSESMQSIEDYLKKINDLQTQYLYYDSLVADSILNINQTDMPRIYNEKEKTGLIAALTDHRKTEQLIKDLNAKIKSLNSEVNALNKEKQTLNNQITNLQKNQGQGKGKGKGQGKGGDAADNTTAGTGAGATKTAKTGQGQGQGKGRKQR